MKKLLLSFILLGFVILTQAQSTHYKPFKFDAALGYAIPSGSGAKGGVLIAFEPKYAVTDNITLGLKLEAAITARAYQDQNGEVVSASAHASAAYMLTGDYYFSNNYVRPFAGLGVGLYSWAGASVDVNGTTQEVAAANSFGVSPRAGVEIGHFRLAVEYNVAGKTGNISNNYLGIKAGFFIGGGRRK